MAVVLLPSGSDMAGKPVNIILPLVGQLCFQPGKLCIGQYHIVVSAISGGGGVSRFSLSLFFYLYLFLSLSLFLWWTNVGQMSAFCPGR